jgi:hypothetical protein
VTQDGLPLIGRVPQIEGVYVATGHNVWGILNAFFHFGDGMAVRNLCRERLSDDELAALLPFRRRLGQLLYRGILSIRPTIQEKREDVSIIFKGACSSFL